MRPLNCDQPGALTQASPSASIRQNTTSHFVAESSYSWYNKHYSHQLPLADNRHNPLLRARKFPSRSAENCFVRVSSCHYFSFIYTPVYIRREAWYCSVERGDVRRRNLVLIRVSCGGIATPQEAVPCKADNRATHYDPCSRKNTHTLNTATLKLRANTDSPKR